MKELRQNSYRMRHGLVLLTTFVVVAFVVISMTFGILADRKYNENTGKMPNNPAAPVVSWSRTGLPTIYDTCNGTHLEQLNEAFEETLNVTALARSRLMKYGVQDSIYKRWFGDGPLYTVIGTIEAVAQMPKKDTIFRCDDIDGRCAANPNYYAGHHRLNATQETVICDYFYTAKLPLSKICTNGSITSTGPSKYKGIDMVHRYFHVPTISLNDYIGEYTEELDEILEMAENNSTFAVRNVDSYLYYLADVYSSSVVPGGCLGDL